MLRAIGLLFIALSLWGCCNGVDCDCREASLAIDYRRGDQCMLPAGARLSIVPLGPDGQMPAAQAPFNRSDCRIELLVRNYTGWLVESETAGISDTVRIQSISYRPSRVRCCQCDPLIDEVSLSLNGRSYDLPVIDRYMP